MSPQDPVIFHATLRAHCSLKRRHFQWLMTSVALLYGGFGLYFLLQGAWPVMGFFGLEFVLLYIAFKLSYRRARLREELTITAQDVHLERVRPNGGRDYWRLSPYWSRLSLPEPVEPATPLVFRSHGKSFSFAQFLSVEEKKSLFRALSAVLSRLR